MWVLPTLGRTKKLRDFFAAAKEAEISEPGRVLVDKDDWKKNEDEYVKINNTLLPSNWSFEITSAVTMGGKIREYVPKLKADTAYVGVYNDDHLPLTKGFDKKLIAKLDGKNFVSANDRRPEAFRFPVTATAWSVPLLKCLDWPIYPPFLEHLFIDTLWHELGKATGCWRLVAGAVVEHMHVLHGKAEEDETHKKVYGENFSKGEPGQLWKDDENNFKIFMAREFPIAVQRIKQMQDYLPGEQWNPKVSGVK